MLLSDADGMGMTALQAFISTVQSNPRQEEISFEEFEDYYEGLSLCVESDEDFANIIRNTWYLWSVCMMLSIARVNVIVF